ncbi:MAG: hypothetical protein WD065_03020 [Planctomycetaceae bacterium]
MPSGDAGERRIFRECSSRFPRQREADRYNRYVGILQRFTYRRVTVRARRRIVLEMQKAMAMK